MERWLGVETASVLCKGVGGSACACVCAGSGCVCGGSEVMWGALRVCSVRGDAAEDAEE